MGLQGIFYRVILRAAAALPSHHREQAAAGLLGQLRVMALAASATPDWSTLVVDGPTAASGLPGRTWFEWRASVEVCGGLPLDDEPELGCTSVVGAVSEDTVALLPGCIGEGHSGVVMALHRPR